MLRSVRRTFLPNAIILLHPPGRQGSKLESVATFVENLTAVSGQATAYLCQNYVCSRPTNDTAEFDRMLSDVSRTGR